METYRKVKCSERLPGTEDYFDTDKGELYYYFPDDNHIGWCLYETRPMSAEYPTWWLEELPNAPVSEGMVKELWSNHAGVEYNGALLNYMDGESFKAALKELSPHQEEIEHIIFDVLYKHDCFDKGEEIDCVVMMDVELSTLSNEINEAIHNLVYGEKKEQEKLWTLDEIIEELKDWDQFHAAKMFFEKFGGYQSTPPKKGGEG